MKDPASNKLFDWLLYLQSPIGNVVQVGANTGQEMLAFERYGVDWAIMIEPLPDAFRELSARAEGRPRYIPVQALCASQEGVDHKFWIASNEGQSSSMLPPTGHVKAFPRVKFKSALNLVSTTVDAVVAEVAADHPQLSPASFDTLLIDVQGAELKVLMGAPILLQHVRQVIAEVSDGLYEGGASLEDLQGFLRSFGFRLNSVRLSREGSGDALFVKREA